MAGTMRTVRHWAIWGVLTLVLLCAAGAVMAFGGPRHWFLTGKTTDAHHQIEMACESCHTDWFGGREAIETGCLSCHEDALEVMNDSHPAKKFRDPRNAPRLEIIEATKCLTCHVEHNEDITREMAVTLPMDYCSSCHQEIAEERPSHEGFGFDTCGNAGCHNYHDNRALYYEYLGDHIGEDWLLDHPQMSYADPSRVAEFVLSGPLPEAATVPDAPAGIKVDAHIGSEWLQSSHAMAGVNCSGCHQPKGASALSAETWIPQPNMAQCAACHDQVATRFTQGKHGMRLAENMTVEYDGLFGWFQQRVLSPMRPELARLPMKQDASHRELTCISCHSSHDFDTTPAQVESCSSCHDDGHTQAYFQSPHYDRWLAEIAGEAPAGSGVSCATCHMPKTEFDLPGGEEIWLADHNQSANLRPNEFMGREVCASCHGLQFTLDSLADEALIANNFKGRPSARVESIDWVERRMRERGELP